MSTSTLKSVVSGNGAKPKNFPAMLDQFKSEIARALPKHLNPDRMARIALTAFRRTPKLGDCDPRSVFAAVIQASQLGLEPDTLGRSYLIPYGKECQFVPGWKGLVDLSNRSGNCTTWTGAVFDGDHFEYALGDRPFVTHKPGDEFDVDLLTHVYAIGRVKGAEWPVIEVWPVSRVKKHRDRYSKVGKRHYSFENFEMYARKVVLLQVLKYMPASAEMSAAISLNDAAEVGKQGLTIDAAVNNDWAPVEDEPEDVNPIMDEEGPGQKQEANPEAKPEPEQKVEPKAEQKPSTSETQRKPRNQEPLDLE
ncbi:recombinase RecT [Nitrosomonas marina]|uniref:Recombination protein RecT n=1 Tax=Nitrosomonas marina TaxID=917 RepID=A0A1H8IZF0_9PROT|nr:recombinase RecT [Nitrosomonas marina]SEN73287.1 recombination protein RecT [Nitrosomonas marina]